MAYFTAKVKYAKKYTVISMITLQANYKGEKLPKYQLSRIQDKCGTFYPLLHVKCLCAVSVQGELAQNVYSLNRSLFFVFCFCRPVYLFCLYFNGYNIPGHIFYHCSHYIVHFFFFFSLFSPLECQCTETKTTVLYLDFFSSLHSAWHTVDAQ